MDQGKTPALWEVDRQIAEVRALMRTNPDDYWRGPMSEYYQEHLYRLHQDREKIVASST